MPGSGQVAQAERGQRLPAEKGRTMAALRLLGYVRFRRATAFSAPHRGGLSGCRHRIDRSSAIGKSRRSPAVPRPLMAATGFPRGLPQADLGRHGHRTESQLSGAPSYSHWRPHSVVRLLRSRRWQRPESGRSRRWSALRSPNRNPRCRRSGGGGADELGECRQRQLLGVSNRRHRRRSSRSCSPKGIHCPGDTLTSHPSLPVDVQSDESAAHELAALFAQTWSDTCRGQPASSVTG